MSNSKILHSVTLKGSSEFEKFSQYEKTFDFIDYESRNGSKSYLIAGILSEIDKHAFAVLWGAGILIEGNNTWITI